MAQLEIPGWFSITNGPSLWDFVHSLADEVDRKRRLVSFTVKGPNGIEGEIEGYINRITRDDGSHGHWLFFLCITQCRPERLGNSPNYAEGFFNTVRREGNLTVHRYGEGKR